MSTKTYAQFFFFLSVVMALSVLTAMNSSFTWTHHLSVINKLLYQTKNTTVINPNFHKATSNHAYTQSHSERYINKTNTSVKNIPVMKTVNNVTKKLNNNVTHNSVTKNIDNSVKNIDNSITKNIDNSITKKPHRITNTSVTENLNNSVTGKLQITRELNNSVKKNLHDTKKVNNSVSTPKYQVISLYNSPAWLVNVLPTDRTQIFKSCNIKTCKLLFESKYSNTSDTVIFDAVSSVKAPKHRKKDQVWIISGWESPYHTGSDVWSKPEWKKQINWTMTYHVDSDIYAPYGLEMSVNRYSKVFIFLSVIIVLLVLTAMQEHLTWHHVSVIPNPLNQSSNTAVINPSLLQQESRSMMKKLSPANKSKNTSTDIYKEVSFVNFPGYYGFSANKFKTCEMNKCRVRKGLQYANTSDALFFYSVHSSVEAPKHRKKDQVWIISGWESPYHTGSDVWSKPEWKNQINWTMTYRVDSDIYAPYGLVEKVEIKTNKNYSAIINQKSKLIAWVVGNCNPPSKRMTYVEQLQKVMKVDIFGRCGKQKRMEKTDIFKTISKTYKFYLGFENSLCTDYITEKFFDRQNLDVIVIARGAGNYTNVYPKNSFIETRDFKNAQELGKYLQYLDKNNTAYIEYLKAKEQVRSVSLGKSIQAGLCQVCKMLHAKNLHRNVYEDYHKWWSEGMCNSKPTDIIP